MVSSDPHTPVGRVGTPDNSEVSAERVGTPDNSEVSSMFTVMIVMLPLTWSDPNRKLLY